MSRDRHRRKSPVSERWITPVPRSSGRPEKNGLIKQFLKDVDWGELDYLVVDTPPGTSDEHLSVNSLLKESAVDGAVVVTTPQEVSLLDVRKEIDFCRKAGIRVLGLVENMSGFVCPKCTHESQVFRATTGGGRRLAKKMGIPFLGAVPLDPRVGMACDYGESFVDNFPDSPASQAIKQVVRSVGQLIERTQTRSFLRTWLSDAVFAYSFLGFVFFFL